MVVGTAAPLLIGVHVVLHSIKYILYGVQFNVYSEHCKPLIVQCTTCILDTVDYRV